MEAANGSTALMKAERDEGLVMHCSPAEAQRRVQELQAFVKANMQHGVDYGVIPGTEKPSLWQPGAQKLCELYGIAHDFADIETIQDWDKGFFLYRKRCVLTMRRNGMFAGAGVGSCNSREDRYAWRWMPAKKVPSNVEKKGLVTREGKYGTLFRVPNADIYSLVNTIEKMACKRALVHAVIGVTRSAGIFTQDVEDLPPEAFGQAEETRPWEKGDVQEAEVVEDSPHKAQALIDAFNAKILATKNDNALAKVVAELAGQPEAVKAGVRSTFGAHKKALKDQAKKATQGLVDLAEEMRADEREPGGDDQ